MIPANDNQRRTPNNPAPPPTLFETDEELDEFLAWLDAERHRDRDLYRQLPSDWDDPEVWPPDEWP